MAAANRPIQYDASGKPYILYVDAKGHQAKSYLAPTVPPAQQGGFLHGRPQWNSETGQWERPMNWGNLAALGIGGVLTGGALSAALGGGAGAAGAGGAASTGAGAGATAAGVGAAGGSSGVLGTLGTLGNIGEVVGGMAGGLGAGRRYDAQQAAQDAAQNNRSLLDVGSFNMAAPSVRTDQTARGEVLSTMHNAPLTGDPRIDKFSSGGLRPDAFGPNSRQAGAALSRQALDALMKGSDQITPQMARPSKAGIGENVLAGTGAGLSILGMLKKIRGR